MEDNKLHQLALDKLEELNRIEKAVNAGLEWLDEYGDPFTSNNRIGYFGNSIDQALRLAVITALQKERDEEDNQNFLDIPTKQVKRPKK